MTISEQQFIDAVKAQYGDNVRMSSLHESVILLSVEINGGVTVRHSNGKWGICDSCAGLFEADTLADADALHTAEYNANYEY
jgi:hypothetical protein